MLLLDLLYLIDEEVRHLFHQLDTEDQVAISDIESNLALAGLTLQVRSVSSVEGLKLLVEIRIVK